MEINTINLNENEEASLPAKPELLEAIKTAAVLTCSAVAFVTVLAVWFASAFPEKDASNDNNAEVETIDVTAGLNSARPVAEAEFELVSANREVIPEVEEIPEVAVLSGLVTSNNAVAGENPQANFAEFEVIFGNTGSLEIK